MHPDAEKRLQQDKEDALLFAPAEALREAIDRGNLSDVLRILARQVKRVDSSSSRAIDHFEFVESDAGYRDAGAPLERMLSEQDVARILASTLEMLARSRGTHEDISLLLRPYLDMHPSLMPLMRAELSAAALELLVLAAPERLLMSFGDMRALAASLVLPSRIAGEDIEHLALGIPPIKKSKRSAMSPLVHALAASNHPKATAVLAALHESGVAVDSKWQGMRPLDRAREAGARQTIALLTRLTTKPKAAVNERVKPLPKLLPKPKPKAKRPRWQGFKNPLASVHIGLVFLLAWLGSWVGHAVGLGFLAAMLPMVLLALYRFDPPRLRWPRNPRLAFQATGLAIATCVLISVVQQGLGGAASILLIAPAFGLSYLVKPLEYPMP